MQKELTHEPDARRYVLRLGGEGSVAVGFAERLRELLLVRPLQRDRELREQRSHEGEAVCMDAARSYAKQGVAGAHLPSVDGAVPDRVRQLDPVRIPRRAHSAAHTSARTTARGIERQLSTRSIVRRC